MGEGGRRAKQAGGPITGPVAYVIAGPNGAGETTFANEFLPHFAGCREFVNADLIAAGLSPFAPEKQALRAGRLLLDRIAELAAARESFGFETTLAGRGHSQRVSDLKAKGYLVVLYFLWLPSADEAVGRVENRVHQGGHDIPETTIRRRYIAGLRHFFRLYAPLVDAWHLYDNSGLPPLCIANANGALLNVYQPTLYDSILSEWGPKIIFNHPNNYTSSLADAAFLQASVKVIQRARQTGTPVLIWEEDQIRAISPDNFRHLELLWSRTVAEPISGGETVGREGSEA